MAVTCTVLGDVEIEQSCGVSADGCHMHGSLCYITLTQMQACQLMAVTCTINCDVYL
jgi:hypothetical protein